MDKRYISALIYGFTGAGKTTFGVSAGWDWKNKKQLRRMKWVRFGRERNNALAVPDSMQIHLASPSLDSDQWIRDFSGLLKQIKLENSRAIAEGKEPPVEVLVIDGMTEFDLMFEKVHKNLKGDSNKFGMWNDLLEECFSIMQMLDPEELHCHVIVTARVAANKEEKKDNKGTTISAADPDYIDSDYYPSMRGSFRLNFPHYFDLVLYVERDTVAGSIGGIKKNNVPVHRIRIVPDKKYLVKNHWEYHWLTSGKPDILDNPSFDDVLDIINELEGVNA